MSQVPGSELLWSAVDAAFDDVDAEHARLLWGEPQPEEHLLLPAPAPALLFGSASPTITSEDAQVLTTVLLEAERDRGEEILKQLGDVQLPSALGLGFTPGEEGSYLGEAAYELLKALAIVSGPWAPIDIEQRANAFAAAFLMPSSLLLSALQKEGGDPSDPETVARVARRLRVSLTSLADRLRNLRLISHEEADDLKLGARRAWERLQRDGDQTSDQVPFDGH